jgi:hypothetical protein
MYLYGLENSYPPIPPKRSIHNIKRRDWSYSIKRFLSPTQKNHPIWSYLPLNSFISKSPQPTLQRALFHHRQTPKSSTSSRIFPPFSMNQPTFLQFDLLTMPFCYFSPLHLLTCDRTVIPMLKNRKSKHKPLNCLWMVGLPPVTFLSLCWHYCSRRRTTHGGCVLISEALTLWPLRISFLYPLLINC